MMRVRVSTFSSGSGRSFFSRGSAWVGVRSSAVHDTGNTEGSGKAVLRLPGGIYDIDVHCLDRNVGSMTEIEISNSMEVDIVAKVHYLTVQAMGNDGKPLSSVEVHSKGWNPFNEPEKLKGWDGCLPAA
jgi:hypothetical protein